MRCVSLLGVSAMGRSGEMRWPRLYAGHPPGARADSPTPQSTTQHHAAAAEPASVIRALHLLNDQPAHSATLPPAAVVLMLRLCSAQKRGR